MKTSDGDTVGCIIVGNARFSTFHEAWLMKENLYYDKQIHTSGVGFFEGDGEGSAVTGETEGLSVGYGLGLGVG